MKAIEAFIEEHPTFSSPLRQVNVHGTLLNPADERILLEQCRNQNRSAQKVLYERHYHKMMPVCQRYLKSEDDALEVMNDAFLKVFSKIHQYKSEGSLEAWIKRIVINSAIDFVRKNKSYRSNFIRTNEFHLYGSPDESDEEELPDESYDFSKEEIFVMVGDLPPATRVVFNLFVLEQFTHKQIAGKLSISEGTSKWHLSNARKILKEKINKSVAEKINTGKYGDAK